MYGTNEAKNRLYFINFKKQGLCDLFCWRGANEFNESQKNNLLKLIQYTNQDCFTFEAAQCLNDVQINIMIEKKKENMLIIML